MTIINLNINVTRRPACLRKLRPFGVLRDKRLICLWCWYVQY